MKAIVCEMCGSGSIIKKEGLFVCEHCGCKYSPEEAKGLLTEVKVKGSVRVEGISTADQLLAKGDTYLRLGDYEAAAETFEQFVKEYPERPVGYKRYIIALTENFTYPEGIDPGELDELISKYKILAGDREDKKSRQFLKKAELCEEYFEARRKLNEAEKNAEELQWQINYCINERSSKRLGIVYFLIVGVLAFFIGGAIGEINDFTIFIFGIGVFGIVSSIINAAQAIDFSDRKSEKEQVKAIAQQKADRLRSEFESLEKKLKTGEKKFES